MANDDRHVVVDVCVRSTVDITVDYTTTTPTTSSSSLSLTLLDDTIGTSYHDDIDNDEYDSGNVATTTTIIDRSPQQQDNYTAVQTTTNTTSMVIDIEDTTRNNTTTIHNNIGTRRRDNNDVFFEQVLFFMAGLGTSVGYIATLSSLVYFTILFGPSSFVELNLAIYLPLLPISLAQAKWDHYYDQQYNTRTTSVTRAVVGFTCIVSGTVGIILSLCPSDQNNNHIIDDGPNVTHQHHHHAKLGWVIWNAMLQGIGGAILYGQLNQLASFVGSRCTDAVVSTGPGTGRRNNTPNTTTNSDGNVDGGDDTGNADEEVDRGDHTNSVRCVDHNNDDDDDHDDDEDDDDDDMVSRKFKAAVSSGVQASAVVVLAASFGSGFGTMNGDRFGTFFWSIVVVEVFCFVMSLWLLVARPRVVTSMIVRDSSIMRRVDIVVVGREVVRGDDPEAQSLLRREEVQVTNSQYDNPHDNGALDEPLLRPSLSAVQLPSLKPSGAPQQMSTLLRYNDESIVRSLSSPSSLCELDDADLWYHTKSCCWALALTLVPSFLVGSWFTRVQTDWMELAQILFYVRIGMDLVGRIATISLPLSTVSTVLWIASLRWIGVILFFLNANQTLGGSIPIIEHNRDVISISLVAVISFFSGYLVTSSYQLAPQQLPMDARVSNNTTKQASLLTVAFSVSAVGGLLSSFALIAIGL